MAERKSVEAQIANLEQKLQAPDRIKGEEHQILQQQIDQLRSQRSLGTEGSPAQSVAEQPQPEARDTQAGGGEPPRMVDEVLPSSVTMKPTVQRPGIGHTTVQCILFERCPRPPHTDTGDTYMLDYYGAKAFSRYLQRLTPCDGSKELDLVKWLRLIQEAPAELRIALATEAATGSLLHFILAHLDAEQTTWPEMKFAIAREYINPNFSRRQQDTLAGLQQRATENILSYNYEFAMLAEEAFPFEVRDPEGWSENTYRDWLTVPWPPVC